MIRNDIRRVETGMFNWLAGYSAAWLVLTLVVGVVCGFLFKRLKVPAGLMIGAFVGVAVLNILTGVAAVPPNTRTAVQIIAGAFVGCSMERSDIIRLRHIARPVLLMLTAFLCLNITLGFAIFVSSPFDLVTSLMCAVPGGINDTPVVAADMGADAPKVAILQLARQILGIGILPLAIDVFDRRLKNRGNEGRRLNEYMVNQEKRVKSKQKSTVALCATVVAVTVAGFLGKASGIPGLTFAAAIVAALLLKLLFDFAWLPKWAKKACQLLAGCYLGTLLGLDGIFGMASLVFPILVVAMGYTLNCLIAGKLQSRFFGYGRKEGMLMMSPAGASDMALIIEDLGVKNTDVVIMQVIRAVVVMTLFPQIVNLICLLFGGI